MIGPVRELLKKPGQCPHILLYGPPGTGKTSLALASMSHLHGYPLTRDKGHHYKATRMVLEVRLRLRLRLQCVGSSVCWFLMQLNASDDRGINVVRHRIKQFAQSTFSGYAELPFKYVILDEADNMTEDAQFALRQGMS